MSFQDIRDQELAVTMLRNMLERGRMSHAVMFWGPGGVGKRALAIELAKAVNCREGADGACGHCLSCRKVDSGNHPDVRAIAPAKKSRNIDVAAIETINELAALRPFEAEWRVFLIHDADRMNAAAQNHFLKTLEEPPGKSLFILITEFPRRLLPTIRSRCQMIRFRRLRPETVKAILMRERDLDETAADAVTSLAQGQMTRAFGLLDSERRDIAVSVVKRLAEGDDPSALAEEFAKSLEAQRKNIEASVEAELAADENEDAAREDRERLKEEQMALVDALMRRDILEYLYLLESWYRDVLVLEVTNDAAALLNRDHIERLRASMGGDVSAKIAAIEKARLYLERFINEERVFRDLFFTLAGQDR